MGKNKLEGNSFSLCFSQTNHALTSRVHIYRISLQVQEEVVALQQILAGKVLLEMTSGDGCFVWCLQSITCSLSNRQQHLCVISRVITPFNSVEYRRKLFDKTRTMSRHTARGEKPKGLTHGPWKGGTLPTSGNLKDK